MSLFGIVTDAYHAWSEKGRRVFKATKFYPSTGVTLTATGSSQTQARARLKAMKQAMRKRIKEGRFFRQSDPRRPALMARPDLAQQLWKERLA